MEKPKYQFVTKMWTVTANYESHVCVYDDKVIITRTGRTGGLPAESTVHFRDATSVSWGKAAGRAWITFTVPGMATSGHQVVTAVAPGTIVFDGPNIPYQDPFSIVFGMKQENDASWYYGKIKAVFDQYKANTNTQKPIVQTIEARQDSVMDKLMKLKELKDVGILSDEEYEEKRKKLLSEI